MVHSRLVTVARARPLASRSRAKHSMSGRRASNRRRWRWHENGVLALRRDMWRPEAGDRNRFPAADDAANSSGPFVRSRCLRLAARGLVTVDGSDESVRVVQAQQQ
jgi:hypothetical protein